MMEKFMWHTSTIELSKSALKKNIRFLKKCIGPKTKFSSVIKGNAYGHGIDVFVPLAESCGVRHFSVFSAYEALRAFSSLTCPDSEIMIMGSIDSEELEWAIVNGISFYVFNLERLEDALHTARRLGAVAKIHLEIETGLHRTGLEKKDLQKAVQWIRKNLDSFSVEGLCTHYAGAESIANYFRIQKQIQSFQEQYQWLQKEEIPIKARHTACSAAALNYPDARMDMVRCGIAHYGFWPTKESRMQYMLNNDQEMKKSDSLRRVMRWKSHIMSKKIVQAGEFIGYGMAYQATRDLKIASVPVGYCHGFARKLSNLGHVLVHGKRRRVVGLVNMNMMMIEITDSPEVKIGDEVVVIGRQKKQQISVASFSDMTNYLNYEVLARLPSEIPRKVVE